ncbi:MAG: hypothetical protein WC262_10380 [Bacteroidales bacterium]|jgi:hypothetical protein
MGKAKASTGKMPQSSKTVWFGIAGVILGVALGVVDVLAQSGTMDAAITSTIMGILMVLLRFKTKVALILGVDDPTTPEDESKGETSVERKTKAEKGFVRLGVLVLVAGIALAFMAGCGTTFTVAKGDLVTTDLRPTMPAFIVANVAGAETFRLDAPYTDILLKITCAPGMVATLTSDWKPICIPNPCAPGTSYSFEADGMNVCK